MSDWWMQDRKYFVSPFNYRDEVSEGVINRPGGETKLYDSTIRKILLTPGLRPRVDEMLEIAAVLERAGISNVTLNLHWWGEAEPEPLEFDVLKAVLNGGFKFTTTVTLDDVFLDHWKSDLDMLSGLGLEEPVFIAWLPKAYDSTARRSEHDDRIRQAIDHASRLGMRPAVAIADVGRVRLDAMLEASQSYVAAGAMRLDIIDSVSSMSPDATGWLFRQVRDAVGEDTRLLLHTHDDFGLATSVAVAAVLAGGFTEVSVNGISDRAGFPALEEVALVLETMHGVQTGLDLSQTRELCETVAALTLPVHPWKAISGRQAWQVDLPYGFIPLLEGGADAFPPPWTCVSAGWLGYQPHIPWVRQFATDPLLRLKLQALGLPTDDHSVSRAKATVNTALAELASYPVWIDEGEVDELLKVAVSDGA